MQGSHLTYLHVLNACPGLLLYRPWGHSCCLSAATVSDEVEAMQCSPVTGLQVLNACQVVLLCPNQVVQTTAAVPL